MEQNKPSNPKVSKSQAIEELWRRGILSFKLDKNQKELYELFHNSEHKVQTWLLARRSGKCLKKGSLIMTPNGPKAIEDFKPGDLVYGYNKDGSLSLTPVIELVYSGTKKVRDIINSNKVLSASTDEHRWLWEDYDGRIKEIPLGETTLKTHKLVRYFIDAPMGDKYVENAYAIGALLGDGCSKQNPNGKQIYISSENSIIPEYLSKLLNCNYRKVGAENYTWVLMTEDIDSFKQKSKTRVECEFYDNWIKDKYAHEKIIDLNEVNKWNRDSQLALLAGLLDTDGSVIYNNNRLTISWSMQSRSVIEAIQYLLLSLFQYRASIIVDNRDKYKNGPVLNVSITSNLFSKRALKELDRFLLLERKKWKGDYQNLPERNNVRDYVGVKLSEYYEAECYDLALNNETHMYATVDGLITHNTYTLCVLALEICLKKPGSIVKFVSPTRLQVQTNIRPLIRQLTEDCPDDLRPEFKTQDFIYYFPNGSELQLAGSEAGHAEKLRGGSSDISIVDEAQDVTDLENVIKSILLPTTLTTKGKVLLAGTPPKATDHPFVNFVEEAEVRGSLVKKTIYENPRISLEDIETILSEYPLRENAEEFRREFLCHIIKDASISVIPEFTDDLEKEVIKEWPTPPYFDTYVSMDLGAIDLTALIFGYYDFRANKLIIQDELVVDFSKKDMNIERLVELIKKKEEDLWTNRMTNEVKKPYLRVSDINPIVTQEIAVKSFGQVYFTNTKKDDKEAAINNMRSLLGGKKIIISPKCENLIRHLRNVKWASAKNRKEFGRSPDNGHYDLVDALIYFCRSVVFSKNPYPSNYDLGQTSNIFIANPQGYFNRGSSNIEAYKKIFGIKGK